MPQLSPNQGSNCVVLRLAAFKTQHFSASTLTGLLTDGKMGIASDKCRPVVSLHYCVAQQQVTGRNYAHGAVGTVLHASRPESGPQAFEQEQAKYEYLQDVAQSLLAMR